MSITTCAFSGQPLREAVVSQKTGHVFERRVIEKHLNDTGQCPITGVELNPKTDLIEIQVNLTALPKPIEATSIPGAFNLLQTECDSQTLQIYNLRKTLDDTRKELAHALYQHDAACRVIARLLKQKDLADSSTRAAKEELTTCMMKLQILERQIEGSAAKDQKDLQENVGESHDMREKKQGQAGESGEGQKEEESNDGLGPEICKTLDDHSKALMEVRKNMKPPPDYAPKGSLKSTQQRATIEEACDMMDVDNNDQYIVMCKLEHERSGKSEETVVVKWYDRQEKREIATYSIIDKPQMIKMYPGKQEALFFYSNEIRFMCPESDKPSHRIGLSASMISFNSLAGHCALTNQERTAWAFYNLETQKKLQEWDKSYLCRADTDPAVGQITTLDFHPDGLILTTGHTSGQLCLWDVRSCKMIKKLSAYKDDPIKCFTFSDRGYLFACASSKTNSVKLFDMRKQFTDTEVTWGDKDSGDELVNDLSFDAFGNYMFVATERKLRVHAAKNWQESQAEVVHDGLSEWIFSKQSFMAIGSDGKRLQEFSIK